jgi:hypothetical protein
MINKKKSGIECINLIFRIERQEKQENKADD